MYLDISKNCYLYGFPIKNTICLYRYITAFDHWLLGNEIQAMALFAHYRVFCKVNLHKNYTKVTSCSLLWWSLQMISCSLWQEFYIYNNASLPFRLSYHCALGQCFQKGWLVRNMNMQVFSPLSLVNLSILSITKRVLLVLIRDNWIIWSSIFLVFLY